MSEPLIIEYSSPGRKTGLLPEIDLPDKDRALSEYISEDYLRKEEPRFPEVSEVDVVRHYTLLSQKNYGLDTGIYPLESGTMKYNPKINEDIANLDRFKFLHPYQDEKLVQGSLEILYGLKEYLAEISGMDEVTLQPASGAHGEFAGLLIIKKHFESRGEKRTKVIVPDSAHGTNPASAAMAGFQVIEIESNLKGMVDIEKLKEIVNEDVAALMLTNPNTLGIFEKDIMKIAEIVHQAGGLLYYDGANMNAIMGYARPGDMNFDVMHFNLHKTFSTPHGGGGPGSGPVGVKEFLKPYLPVPVLSRRKIGEMTEYCWDYDRPDSIGKIHTFYGNYAVLLKAYSYIRCLGAGGLKASTENAVLNANYLKEKLKDEFLLPYQEDSLHEFVLSGLKQKEMGIPALQIAKRLLDYGQYAPTIYFPLVVKEAMMVEPTETESLRTLDKFVETMKIISREIKEKPELVKNAPQLTPVKKLDEVKAAREPDLRW
ncbi:MAG: aminomethyl-transferring glycine dehydrogenase subunit GcvPB [Halanaerobiaceae bacterium]|nr:aminomethyl-transferring glycine dehydrogenase subunit GcvPB [Halanaerobiaceae bacterium]